MADYRYVSTWQLQAPIEPVWAALNDLEHLPAWYSGVQEARELIPGDAQGVGIRVRYVIKGRLSLRLAFEVTTTRSVPPREQELQAEGELAGTGRWLLDQQGKVTTVPLPVGGAFDQAVDELAGAAGAAAVHLEQQGRDAAGRRGPGQLPGRPAGEGRVTPAWSGMRRLGWAALAVSLVWLVGRRVRSAEAMQGTWCSTAAVG
jgi:hypothetical protein